MIPDREGRYIAEVLDKGFGETGKNNLATFTCRVRLLNFLRGDPVQGTQEITAYIYIDKKDGSINQKAVEQIQRTFGWDGSDLTWLAHQDLAGRRLQVELRFETWNNQRRMKVQWIDHVDAAGAPEITRCDDEGMRRMNARLGSKLRAGAKSLPARQETTPTPAATTAQHAQGGAPPAAQSPPGAAYGTEALAWGKFQALETSHNMTRAQTTEAWHKAVEKIIPGKEYGVVTAAEWQKMSEQALPF